MLKRLIGLFIDRFERRYDYDAGYMRDLLAADTRAFTAFSKIRGFSGYRQAPAAALVAAGLVGTMAEDCGPCTQIVVRMAEEQGFDAAIIKALLTGDEAATGPDALLAWRFCRASLARDMEAADPLRDEIVRRWGNRALAAIALQLAAARVYPTVKYALGHGKACSRVQVSGEGVAANAA